MDKSDGAPRRPYVPPTIERVDIVESEVALQTCKKSTTSSINTKNTIGNFVCPSACKNRSNT
ncbi:MAG: hypothetical protein DME08_12635 [Candidatus Rokuibacteriota bacterium]|nr:MAG: hypothetical protein DME08_12635 [Candidatus Rokubacteria bacterium]